MNIIFLYGSPGVGKLTVGQELAQLTGYKLFHNHLTADLVYSVFDFGTRPYIELREKIWMMILEKAKEEKVKGLIFTFAPEETVPSQFIPNLLNKIEDEENKILFVKLICDPEELRKRIVNPARFKYHKATKTNEIEEYYKRDHLIPKNVHDKAFILDNTYLSPIEVANRIIKHFHLTPVKQ